MNKTTHTPRGLKSQKHIDRVLYNLERYIAHYRVPQPQQLREATSQLIVGNLAPHNAFYHDKMKGTSINYFVKIYKFYLSRF